MLRLLPLKSRLSMHLIRAIHQPSAHKGRSARFTDRAGRQRSRHHGGEAGRISCPAALQPPRLVVSVGVQRGNNAWDDLGGSHRPAGHLEGGGLQGPPPGMPAQEASAG